MIKQQVELPPDFVNKILDLLLSFARAEFDPRIPTENLDGQPELIATALNMLGDELQAYYTNFFKAQQEMEVFSQVIEQSPVSVVITDPQGNIEYANKHFEKITGYSLNEVKGQNPRILKSGLHTKEFYQEMWTAIQSGKIWTGELVNRKKNGEIFTEAVSISLVKDREGKTSHYVAVKDDITDKKAAEKEIIEARKAAETANQAKSEFLANMSHEIRTPLNAIIGMNHLLKKSGVTPEQNDFINKIEQSSYVLLRTINDILDVSKIEAGKMEFEEAAFDIHELCERVINITTLKAEEKGLELICSTDLKLRHQLLGDSFRIEQILLNLIYNAIKFTDKGHIHLFVKVESVIKEVVTLKFSVEDTGIGISQDQISRLFKEFSQADSSTTRKYGGTGLGLSISKKLTELMGGTIWFESIPGQGTTFNFKVPLKFLENSKSGLLAKEFNFSDLEVLVIDDNSKVCKMITDSLSALKFKAESTSTGHKALELISQRISLTKKIFDLIVIDFNLENLAALETIKKIQAEFKIHCLPKILMITTSEKDHSQNKTKLLEIDGFLVKPITQSRLFNAIANVFKQEIFISMEKQESDSPPLPGDIESIGGKKILVVEDNEINRDLVRHLLKGLNLELSFASNGKIACEMVSDSNNTIFDLILMDLQMPIMDGFEATNRIRQFAKYKDIPIIALTADALLGVKDKCFKNGMDDYITKPFNPEELYQKVIKWINNKSTQPSNNPPKLELFASPDSSANPNFLNVTAGLKATSGNLELYRNILEKFIHNHKNSINELYSLNDANDFISAKRLIHTIKGISGTIGAIRLNKMSKETELFFNLSDENKRLSHNQLIELETCLHYTLKDIEKYLDREQRITSGKVIKPVPEKTCSRDELINKIDQIITHLKNFNSKGAKIFKELIESNQLSKSDPLILKAKTLLDLYNFEKALEVISEIRSKI